MTPRAINAMTIETSAIHVPSPWDVVILPPPTGMTGDSVGNMAGGATGGIVIVGDTVGHDILGDSLGDDVPQYSLVGPQ